MRLLKRLFCKHEWVNTSEYWSVFGKDHITRVCVKCGKRTY